MAKATTATKASVARKMGRPRIRPTADDAEAIELLCELLAQGHSMKSACADPRCPTDNAVYVRMAKDAAFFAVIAQAREAQQHVIIDQTVAMADAATETDWQVVKLRIWARQWRAAKLAPKVYGDRIDHNHTGKVTLEALVTAAQQIPAPNVIEGNVEDEDENAS